MNLSFADRDYYGDPRSSPTSREGLLSKEYAEGSRREESSGRATTPTPPGDPYPFEGRKNPYLDLLEKWRSARPKPKTDAPTESGAAIRTFEEGFYAGTTSVEAADAEGWVVSVTPSGGWVPAVIAGKTGIGMSQRM
jgi:gamma-glutamyltranspeptidase/glutathione hydrolase